MLDLVLAIAHHLAAFALAGFLCAQFVTLRGPIDRRAIQLLTKLDIGYGVSAALVLMAGVARVLFAAKGWEYYAHNWAFWAKMTVFAVIGLISIYPTLRFRGWRKSVEPAIALDATKAVKRAVSVELALFPLIPILAAAMARGFGAFG
jgi:putative membrane protein